MAEQVTIASFEKIGRRFILTFADTSSMVWSDENVLDHFIDNGKEMDSLVRGLLRRIRNVDPTYANIGNIQNVIYERPDVREVP